MKDLLLNYSINEILIFIVMLAIAIKWFLETVDWFKNRINTKTDKFAQHKKACDDLVKKVDFFCEKTKESIEKTALEVAQIKQSVEKMQCTIDMLVESDKDDIKSWITDRHHFFVYEQKYIDDYHLDCVEKRYSHYIDEGGNSFIKALMEEIRNLPKISNIKENK